MIKYYCNRKEDIMTNYFLLVMENGEPLQNVEEFMEVHNLNDLIEKALDTEDKQITLENYLITILAFEVEDKFLEFLDGLTPIPGLIWLAPISGTDEEMEDIIFDNEETNNHYVC